MLRAPKSKRQQRVLRLLAGSGLDVSSQQTVVAGTLTALEDSVLGVLEQGAATKTVTRLRYQSHSDAVAHWRHVSVQRVMVGQPVRFVGLCHKATQLRWYRLDRVSAAELAGQEPWQSVSVEVLDKFYKRKRGRLPRRGNGKNALLFGTRPRIPMGGRQSSRGLAREIHGKRSGSSGAKRIPPPSGAVRREPRGSRPLRNQRIAGGGSKVGPGSPAYVPGKTEYSFSSD